MVPFATKLDLMLEILASVKDISRKQSVREYIRAPPSCTETASSIVNLESLRMVKPLKLQFLSASMARVAPLKAAILVNEVGEKENRVQFLQYTAPPTRAKISTKVSAISYMNSCSKALRSLRQFAIKY